MLLRPGKLRDGEWKTSANGRPLSPSCGRLPAPVSLKEGEIVMPTYLRISDRQTGRDVTPPGTPSVKGRPLKSLPPRKKRWRPVALACTALICATVATTGLTAGISSQTGRIQALVSRSYANGTGLVYVVLEGQRVGAPPCATGNYWMIPDEKSEAGKRDAAILTAARLSDMPVTIIGRQSCTKWVDGEDILEIDL